MQSAISAIPAKETHEVEIKVWVCADAKTAYIMRFSIYTGKANDIGKGLAYCVVMNLLQDYLGKHYKVYFDNFYTSPKLVADT